MKAFCHSLFQLLYTNHQPEKLALSCQISTSQGHRCSCLDPNMFYTYCCDLTFYIHNLQIGLAMGGGAGRDCGPGRSSRAPNMPSLPSSHGEPLSSDSMMEKLACVADVPPGRHCISNIRHAAVGRNQCLMKAGISGQTTLHSLRWLCRAMQSPS